MKIEAVIFDLDGVLVDSEPLYMNVFKAFIENTGHKVDDQTMGKLVGLSAHQDYELVSQWTNNYFKNYETYRVQLKNHFQNWGPIDYYDVVNDGLYDLLKHLKENGIKIGLASASKRETIERALNQIKVMDYFDFYLSGHEVARSKPYPDVYLAVAQQLRVNPEHCLVIEDSQNGIKAGKAAGMYVIAKREERFGFSQTQADQIIDDLTQFPFELLRKEI